MRKIKQGLTGISLLTYISFFTAMSMGSSAEATMLLGADNREVRTSGFGQAQGTSSSWDVSATPAPPYAPFTDRVRGGVMLDNLPLEPYDAFILGTSAHQSTTVNPYSILGSGSASIDTGDNNAVLGAQGSMLAESVFAIEFSIDRWYRADFSGALEFMPLAEFGYDNGTYQGRAYISLIDQSTQTPVFSRSFEGGFDFGNDFLNGSQTLNPGTYELMAGVFHEFSFSGYADLCDSCGFGKYDLDLKMTSIPEPPLLALVAMGILIIRFVSKAEYGHKY